MFGLSKEEKKNKAFIEEHGMLPSTYENLQRVKRNIEEEDQRSQNPHQDFLDYANET